MIKNIIFDFGGVLIDWNPHYLFDTYFNDIDKSDWFIENVCNFEWNAQMDKGKPFDIAVKERIELFPEYEEAIRLYQTDWLRTIGGEIEGMYDLISNLKKNGFPVLYGLTNWSAETLPMTQKKYPIFSLIDNVLCSGVEKMLKPNPEIYELLLRRYDLIAEESLFIDDNLANVKGAEDVGIRAVQFLNAEQLKKDLSVIL